MDKAVKRLRMANMMLLNLAWLYVHTCFQPTSRSNDIDENYNTNWLWIVEVLQWLVEPGLQSWIPHVLQCTESTAERHTLQEEEISWWKITIWKERKNYFPCCFCFNLAANSCLWLQAMPSTQEVFAQNVTENCHNLAGKKLIFKLFCSVPYNTF
jgi:hypothetical protein